RFRSEIAAVPATILPPTGHNVEKSFSTGSRIPKPVLVTGLGSGAFHLSQHCPHIGWKLPQSVATDFTQLWTGGVFHVWSCGCDGKIRLYSSGDAPFGSMSFINTTTPFQVVDPHCFRL